MSATYPLSKPTRALTLLAGIGTLALLTTARILEPASDGLGTHQQLGLPPCTSIYLFGVRCPSCGMTTAWALTTRGLWIEALQVNAGGFLLALIALAYLPASCYFFLSGRSSRGGWFSLSLAISLMVALAVATLQWCFRVWG
jgi:hypothetical protein